MSYFEYLCKGKYHSHRISTDAKIRSEKKLKCKFCGQQMQEVKLGYEKEKDAAKKI